MRRFLLALAIATALAAPQAAPAAVTPLSSSTPMQAAALPGVRIRVVRAFSGFDQPLYVTHAGDRTRRLWVVEKTGRIKLISRGRVVARPWLDLSAKVSTNSERGLLGLAFPPDYEKTGRFYVNYTDRAGDTVIARYRADRPLSDTPRVYFAEQIMKIAQPYANHNGGCLQFGPDGYLYIGMGDGGSAGDPGNRAQNPATRLGKMLRIDVSRRQGTKPYAVPADNPFVGTSGYAQEIWALGLRNPWRFSFDRVNKHLWIGDVGQNTWEEIDFQNAGRGGQNWGWNVWEANHSFPPGTPNPGTAGFSFPIAEYGHPDAGYASGGESVTGGYVYRGGAYPSLRGVYFYADFVNGRIWGLKRTWTGSAAVVDGPKQLADTALNMSSFGESETGELYLTAFDGRVYQVKAY